MLTGAELQNVAEGARLGMTAVPTEMVVTSDMGGELVEVVVD